MRKVLNAMSSTNQIKILLDNIAHKKTYNSIAEYTFKWTIENYSHLEDDEYVVGPNFHLNPDEEWHAEIKKIDDSFYFYLHRHSGEPAIEVKYKITVSNINGKKICSNNSVADYTEDETFHDLFPDYLIKTTDLINDLLLITLKLEMSFQLVTFNLETNSTRKDFSCQTLNTLKKDLKKLCTNPKLADVTLRVGNQEALSAHKVILSARSPVFERMFEQKDTVEHRNGIVEVNDIDMSTLKELIAFMYSGDLVDYDFETAINVYYAADKYAVMELRQHCSRRVVSGLTKLNAGRALTLAEQHDDQTLKDSVFEFIVHHYEQSKRKTEKVDEKQSEPLTK